MKLADFSRKGTEAVTGVVSALRRRRPTELSKAKISQILRCSLLLVRDPGFDCPLRSHPDYTFINLICFYMRAHSNRQVDPADGPSTWRAFARTMEQ